MDNKQERNLVDDLAQRNPVLYATYRKTEEVVINHWYPGISAKNGSTNSYPHVQGVIQQLSLVVYHPQCAVTLSEAELYLLLTSVLLHDIGKVQQSENHGQRSQALIQSHWAELKIENEQMQRIIQTICLLHDRESDFREVYQRLPVDEYIDRYGKVRPRLLGALLYLGDHMDNSYTRTMTQEFTKHFRRSVLGVHFQPEQQLITTVIDPAMFFFAQTEKQRAEQQAAKKDAAQSETKKDEEPNDKVLLHSECEKCLLNSVRALGQYLEPDPNQQKADADVQIYLDADSIRYLLQDTFDNDACLGNIKNELYVLGMPIKKWMIECKGQLFLVQKQNSSQIGARVDSYDLETLFAALEKLEKDPTSGDDIARKNGDASKSNASEQPHQNCEFYQTASQIFKYVREHSEDKPLAERIRLAEGKQLKGEPSETELADAYRRLKASHCKRDEDCPAAAPFHPKYHTALSIEPLTGYDYCVKVLEGMYEITSTIFAKSFFSYTDLCNYLREDPNNTRKVMSAVRRLSFLFQHMTEFGEANANYRYKIYYDDQVWNLKNTVCDRACSLSGSSGSDKNTQEPQPSNSQEICYIRPKPNEEPYAFLKFQQEQGTIADWTKEAKKYGEK